MQELCLSYPEGCNDNTNDLLLDSRLCNIDKVWDQVVFPVVTETLGNALSAIHLLPLLIA